MWDMQTENQNIRVCVLYSTAFYDNGIKEKLKY